MLAVHVARHLRSEISALPVPHVLKHLVEFTQQDLVAIVHDSEVVEALVDDTLHGDVCVLKLFDLFLVPVQLVLDHRFGLLVEGLSVICLILEVWGRVCL
jgi:hypothetical protein